MQDNKKIYMMGLLEASLEPLPKELWATSKARSLAKRYRVSPRYIILDKSVFYDEMKKLGINQKRGRPDIIHQFLLATQYSLLNKKGHLRIFIHTINNEIITIEPETRIPKNYFQFINLMQHLYMKKELPEKKKPLIKLHEKTSLKQFLKTNNIRKLILLREEAPQKDIEWFRDKTHPPHAIGIGGFPHGDFSKPTIKLSWTQASLYDGESYDAWIITDRIICNLEKTLL